MSPQWKSRITMAILLLVLLAFVVTSFGCESGNRKKSPFYESEQTAKRAS